MRANVEMPVSPCGAKYIREVYPIDFDVGKVFCKMRPSRKPEVLPTVNGNVGEVVSITR